MHAHPRAESNFDSRRGRDFKGRTKVAMGDGKLWKLRYFDNVERSEKGELGRNFKKNAEKSKKFT